MTETDFTFELPSPGSWDRSRTGLALVNEESAHAAFCLFLGIPMREVRIDNPICSGPPAGGWVKTIPDTSIDGLQDYIYAVLAGPLAVGREISWPPSHVDGEDESILARLTFILGYDKERWNSAVFFVKEILALPSTQRAMKAITSALLDRGAIPGDEIRKRCLRSYSEGLRAVIGGRGIGKPFAPPIINRVHSDYSASEASQIGSS